ncbi:hypothetical protein E3U55_16960, partial [Filobacillus milosensis]
FFIRIGKGLKLSPPFPLVHTVRATFTAYGVPTNSIHSFLCINFRVDLHSNLDYFIVILFSKFIYFL